MKLIISIIFAWLLQSCAVFESNNVDVSQPSKDRIKPEAGMMSYFLPSGRVRLQITNLSDGSLTITPTVQYVPDLSETVFLKYSESWLSSDQIKVSLTDNGLLSSISSTTTDATPQIFHSLGELAANTLKLMATAAGGGTPAPQLLIDEVIDPLDANEINKLNQELVWIGLSLLPAKPDVGGVTSREISSNSPSWGVSSGKNDGIVYRPALPYRLTFVSDPDNAKPVNGVNPPVNKPPKGIISTTIALPNEAPKLILDVSRAAFVSNSAIISFNNGMLKEITYNKPSQAQGLVQIPVDLTKTLLSVPADLLTIRHANATEKLKEQTDKITNRATIVNDQSALLKAEKDFISAQQALRNAQQDAACTSMPKPPGCP
jgi:hypothetical protein